MIYKLIGTLLEKYEDRLIINVSGVCYEVFIAAQTFNKAPDINSPCSIYTDFIIKENSQTLYGFFALAEKTIFQELLKINGIGPKVALNILSTFTLQEFATHITQKNTKELTKVVGLGAKTADKICLELSHKKKIFEGINMPQEEHKSVTIKEEVHQALRKLGYEIAEIEKLIESCYTNQESSAKLIKDILRQTKL